MPVKKTQKKPARKAPTKKSPMRRVHDDFGGKDKLVDELLALLKRPSDLSKDDLKKKLRAQSNGKLLILLQREKTIRDRFGSRDKLVEALLSARMGKAKKEDKGYRIRLERLSSGQLLDLAHREL